LIEKCNKTRTAHSLKRSGTLASLSSDSKLSFGSAKADQNPCVLRTPGILEMCLNGALNQIALWACSYYQLSLGIEPKRARIPPKAGLNAIWSRPCGLYFRL